MGTEPDVKMSAALSLTIRPMDKIIAVTTPDNAEGRMTLKIVLTLEAPSARDPSRMELGTAKRLSSTERIIVGKIIKANVSAPAHRETPFTQNMIMPNNPNTMDGIPDNVSIKTRRTFTILEPGLVYSTRKIAVAVPIGTATSRDMRIIQPVDINAPCKVTLL